MSAEVVQMRMTKRQAQACVEKIRSCVDSVRDEVYRLHEGRGWEALEYRSWRECVVAEFPQAERTLYKELTAAKVERNVLPHGANASSRLSERHARELAKLKDPEEQRSAYARVTAEHDNPTARDFAAVVTEMLPVKRRLVETSSDTSHASSQFSPEAALFRLDATLLEIVQEWPHDVSLTPLIEWIENKCRMLKVEQGRRK